MNFGANKTTVEIIKERVFGGTYCRDFHFSINDKWYKNSGKEFAELKNINQKCYSSNYYDVNINEYGVKCGTPLRF